MSVTNTVTDTKNSRAAVDEINVLNRTSKPLLPTDAATRKRLPIFTGVLQYFPLAIAQVSSVSFVGNEQHNPGEPLHWARGKSMDQMDTAARHMVDWITHKKDTDGQYHLAKAAWRILAQLQLDLEEERNAYQEIDNDKD